MGVECLLSKTVEVFLGERIATLARVERSDVVQHGESTSGCGSTTNSGTGVVLDTKAQRNALKLQA